VAIVCSRVVEVLGWYWVLIIVAEAR